MGFGNFQSLPTFDLPTSRIAVAKGGPSGSNMFDLDFENRTKYFFLDTGIMNGPISRNLCENHIKSDACTGFLIHATLQSMMCAYRGTLMVVFCDFF